MAKQQYIYDIDERPPLRYGLLYGLQWTIIMFPALIIISTMVGKAFHLEPMEEVRFLQLLLLTSGFFTAIQSLWGHRYPVLEGPATALLLTFIVLAPYGIQNIQGGTILGGALLICLVLTGEMKKVISFATPNVVGVILMLIAFTLLPYLARSMAGVNPAHPHGEAWVFFISLGLVLLMAAFSYWLTGVWKTVSLLIGMAVGAFIFFLLDLPSLHPLSAAPWVSVPNQWIPSRPTFYWPALVAFASSYVAVMVNSLGSLHGIANLTDKERLPSAISRGIFFNGVSGIFCGLFGIVGTVCYSTSPGVILANRVASRFTVACCGIVLIIAAFVPKLSALLALVPPPVVGAALCVAMGAQVGAGLAIVSTDEVSSRDYFVVGLPMLLGTLVGFLPDALIASMPPSLRVFLGNGLLVGIFLVLLLEHLVMRKKADK
jgi:uracil permease